jgi:DNA polymerase-3 subunit epsilon
MPAPATAQLSLDGADRLVSQLAERRAPMAMAEAASSLFALRGAPPSALVRQLVDEVVRSDARLVWRSATEVALADWEAVASLHDLPLESAPFVVFDLETTGTRPGAARIVEIGAVRLHGFEEVGTYEQLVDPGVPVPITITRITGIETRDVRGQPRIGRVLPRFLEFAQGAVLVAHNARFDVGFVDAELSRLEARRLAAPVIDTVALARRLLEGRVPRMNLGTLAERFDTDVRPCHRALPDAQATAEVLVHLLGMAQEHGVRTVADAVAFAAPIRRRARLRRELARDVPTGPGVYLFHDRHDRVLYVGKATDLRARVRSYFAGSQQRRPVEHALEATARIETRPVGSSFEAALLELELILRLRPDANRRSAHPERSCYLTLTTGERVPRLSVTSAQHPGEVSVGPLRSRSQAQAAAAAMRTAFGLRSCRPALPEDDGSCLAGLLGRCAAPCRGGENVDAYAEAVGAATAWLRGDDDADVAAAQRTRMAALAADHRFEEAAQLRDELEALEDVRAVLARLRRAAAREGLVIAADLDDRFVQAFACAGGRVVARRRLPRAGDTALELRPLAAALDALGPGPRAPLAPDEADTAHLIAAAFARPGREIAAVPLTGPSAGGLVDAVVRARRRVPLRR